MWCLLFVLSSSALLASVDSQRQRCYSCTTLDAKQLLKEVQDEGWKRWLTNVQYVPKTSRCGDKFRPESAIRAGALRQPCEEGMCMKMWFRERGGEDHVWRSCIPNARDFIKTDCTKISSSEGDMEVCTCTGNLCNGQISDLRFSNLSVKVLAVSSVAAILASY